MGQRTNELELLANAVALANAQSWYVKTYAKSDDLLYKIWDGAKREELILDTTYQTLYQAYAYNMPWWASTVNGITTTAATWASLSGRRSFLWFDDANDINAMAFTNFELPKNYIAGRDIKVEIHFTYSSASGWDILRGLGLQRVNDTDEYEWDGWPSEFDETVFSAWIHTDFEAEKHEFVFDGTGYGPWDTVSAMVYRNTTGWNADTLAVPVYVNILSVYS